MCGTTMPKVAESPVVESLEPENKPTPVVEANDSLDENVVEPELTTLTPPVTLVEPLHLPPTPTDTEVIPEPETIVADTFVSVMHERQSPIVLWITGFFIIILVVIGSLVWQNAPPVADIALFPTITPFPPTATHTPTVTIPPSETPTASLTPSLTPPPTATETPQPPREHPVTAGETLYVLSLFYDVSIQSIADANGIAPDTPIQLDSTILVPWPTATPPLTAIETEINGEPVIADPIDCERAEIQEGDSIVSVAVQYRVDFNVLLEVNRLTEESILRPGDTVCIPAIIVGGFLPPTPGPSPTPSPTGFPAGPTLLYPPNNTTITDSNTTLILQWLAVKDLEPDEWYMVQVTNMDDVTAPPQRAFTRDNTFTVPSSWRPITVEEYDFKWHISIVRVTGQRQDGSFIYAFGGRNSQENTFTWLGAIPTATPTPTPSPIATP